MFDFKTKKIGTKIQYKTNDSIYKEMANVFKIVIIVKKFCIYCTNREIYV